MSKKLCYWWHNHDEHGYQLKTLTVFTGIEHDARKVLETYLGSSSEDHYVKKASHLKSETGQFNYYYRDHCSEVEIRWQWYVYKDGQVSPENDRWIAPRVQMLIDAAPMLTKIIRATSKVFGTSEPTPELVQIALKRLKAIPVYYDTSISDYVPDFDDDAMVETEKTERELETVKS